jgi:hypothetical protein
MTRSFSPVELPLHAPGGPATSIEASVAAWIHSPPFVELIEVFDGPDLASGSLLCQLHELDEFSARWDFRAGKERNLAETARFADEHEDVILAAARALGLVDSKPPRHDKYDHMVILGGLIRACVLRPRLAAVLLGEGVSAETITGIGAFRPLGGDEPALAAAAGLSGLETEFDAMDAGMRRAFGLETPEDERGEVHAENANLSWLVRTYRASTGSTVSVVAAPTTDPARRANTPDSYRYWAEALVHVQEGQRVLLVTSAIYIPFQHADAIRMLGLPYGADVDTVGVDTTTVREPELRQTFTSSNYLQEVRSAIRSFRSLVEASHEVMQQ